MNVLICFTILVCLIGEILMKPEICNPFECFNVLDTLFQPNSAEEPCQKLIKVEKCVKNCAPKLVNSFVINGIEEVKKDFCSSEQRFQIVNKCENKHKYLLLACIYESFHLEALEADTNQTLLMCRQASEGQHCDISSLSKCIDREYYLSGVALESFFRPLYNKNCHFSIADIYDLKLRSLAYTNAYKKLAECLDGNSPFVSECIPKKWIFSNFVVDAHFDNKLCRAGNSFLSCVREVVQNKCGELESIFEGIGKSLYKTFLPQCSKLSEVSYAHKSPLLSDKILNEVYDFSSPPSSTDLPKNESEMVVVHQHVIINVNYHETNCAAVNRIMYFLIAALFIYQYHYLRYVA
ncbi:uncharacterized protein CDAR_118881 [Caerostris darwini]|uniref:Uncharacterized protein n=1 Tax=Caerostris darwini TaxID=1538125 RepID=A0AAV4VC30_9ARAC|nr:uncharacterized protein CDAR_118881 [Caerostris darwini]